MLSITDSVTLALALSSALNPQLKHLIARRSDQLGGNVTDHARFIIIQPCDTLEDLEGELGFPVAREPCFEWVHDHGFAYECVAILTDDGFAHVALIEKVDGIDPELKALCEAYAEVSA